MADEQALFLSDILPTGYQAAENCDIQPGDTVAVWGCGPVGQFALQSARWLGAEHLIAIDHIPQRLQMAARYTGAETINFDEQDVTAELNRLTFGMGPDCCIDAVGLEAHGTSVDAVYDRVKQATYLATDRLHVLRQAIYSCRKGGTLSIPGVYGGFLDKVPFGAAFAKGLKMKMGQTHVHRYLQPLLDRLTDSGNAGQALAEAGAVRHWEAKTAGGAADISSSGIGDGGIGDGETSWSDSTRDTSMAAAFDPTYIISHRIPLKDAADAYRLFHENKNDCTKVVLKP
jgi:threonine dehydrogenase-like Zn-dependent dehydrogenase